MTETYFSSIKNTFDQYLRFNRNLNQNTIRNYLNDTETFIKYLELAEFTNFKEINRNTIRNYLHWLITGESFRSEAEDQLKVCAEKLGKLNYYVERLESLINKN